MIEDAIVLSKEKKKVQLSALHQPQRGTPVPENFEELVKKALKQSLSYKSKPRPIPEFVKNTKPKVPRFLRVKNGKRLPNDPYCY